MATSHEMGALALGLNALLGKPGQDPIRSFLAIRALESLRIKVTRAVDGGPAEVARAIKEISDAVQSFEMKWKKATNSTDKRAALLDASSRLLGLDQTVAKAIASGDLFEWAKQPEVNISRSVQDLRANANEALADIRRIVDGPLSPEVEMGIQSILASALNEKLDPEKLKGNLSKTLTDAGFDPSDASSMIDVLVANKPINDAAAKALVEQAANLVTGKLADLIPPSAKVAVELVQAISDLDPKLPSSLTPTDAANALATYGGLAQSALALVDKKAAKEVGQAVATLQTGMQVCQAAQMMMACSGFGAAIAAASLLGGTGGLGSLGTLGGGNDSTGAVLAAIADLKSFIADQFKALNKRLDRMEETLGNITEALQLLNTKVTQAQWMLASLTQDTMALSVQAARGDYAIVEEIDEQLTIEWSAYRDARLTIPPRDIARFKGFFASRALDAFDQIRTYQSMDAGLFDRLAYHIRSSSALQLKGAPAEVVEDQADKEVAPLSLLVAAINHFEAEGKGQRGPGPQLRLITERRTPVNLPIVIAAIEGYCEVHLAQRRLDSEFVAEQTSGLDDMTRAHLRLLRRALSCAKGMIELAKPSTDSGSTLGMLLEKLDDEMKTLKTGFQLLEWQAVRTYLLEVLQLDSTGPEGSFSEHWRGMPKTVRQDILFSIPSDQDAAYPSSYLPVLETTDPWFGNAIPPIFSRSLVRSDVRPLELKVDVPVAGSPAQNRYKTTYKFSFNFYGSSLTDKDLIADHEFDILFYGFLPDDQGNASRDSIWSRISSPSMNQAYLRNARRLWYFGRNQWGRDEPADGWGKHPDQNPWGIVKARLNAVIPPLKEALLDGAIKSVKEVADKNPGNELLSVLLRQINPVRDLLFGDFVTREAGVDVSLVSAPLKRIDQLLTTIRAILMFGMPASYYHTDLVHALFDGSSKVEGQIRLPYADLLKKEEWTAFMKVVVAEAARDLGKVKLNLTAIQAKPLTLDDPLPYHAVLDRSVDLLKRCIEKMIMISDKADVPYRLYRAEQLLDEVEKTATATTQGTKQSSVNTLQGQPATEAIKTVRTKGARRPRAQQTTGSILQQPGASESEVREALGLIQGSPESQADPKG